MAVFGVLAVMFVGWYRSVEDAWFSFDDYSLAVRGWTAGDFVEPYNGHLSITYIAVYRAFYSVFGFSHHAVLQLVGLVAYLSVPVAFYLTTRSVLGRGWAGLVAVALAGTRGATLEPGAMNHWATLAAAVIVARALRGRSRRADAVLAVALLGAFATSGGAIAIASAVVLHNLFHRAPLRRWAAVLVPLAAWLAWRPFEEPEVSAGPLAVGMGGRWLRMVVEANPTAVVGVVGGSRVVAGVVVALLVGGLLWVVVRYRMAGVAAVVPWVGASYVWWVGLIQSRGVFADAHILRYRYVATVFLALAVVDAVDLVRDRADDGDERASAVASWVSQRRVPAWGSALAIVVLALGLHAANRTVDDEVAQRTVLLGQASHVQFQILTAVPEVWTSDAEHSINLGALGQSELLAAVEAYGPSPMSRPELDRWLVEQGTVAIDDDVVEASPANPCRPTSAPEELLPASSARVVAGDAPATVLVRRFGAPWHEVGRVPAGSAATLEAQDSYAAPRSAWDVRVEGGCLR